MELEIFNYVKNAKLHGLSDSVIKQNLLDAGWDAYEVDEAYTHFKATEHHPEFNRDEDIAVSTNLPSSPAQEIHTVTTGSGALTTQAKFSTSTGDLNGQKKIHTIKILGFLLMFAIFLAGGTYAVYAYVLNSPEKIWKKYITNEKNQIYKTLMSFSYNDLEKLEGSQFAGMPFNNIKLSVKADAYFDGTDPKNHQTISDLKYDFGSGNTSISTGFSYRLLNNVLYVNVAENLFLKSYVKALTQNDNSAWVKIDLNALKDVANQQKSQVPEIFNQAFEEEIVKLWQEGKYVKIDKYIGKEKINGIQTMHFKNSLDKEAVKMSTRQTIQKFFDAVIKLENMKKNLTNENIQKIYKISDSLIDKLEIKQFETWIGIKDGNLYQILFISNAPSFVSLIKEGSKEKEKNHKNDSRITDLKQIALALEHYFKENKQYPQGQNGKPVGLAPAYLPTLPVAPVPADNNCNEYFNSYWYEQKNGGKSYSISFCVGENTLEVKPGIGILTPAGIETNIGCPGPVEHCPQLISKNLATATDFDKAKNFFERINFNSNFEFKANYSDFGKATTVEAPAESLDIIKILNANLIKNPVETEKNLK